MTRVYVCARVCFYSVVRGILVCNVFLFHFVKACSARSDIR